jgi:hypothetical protein
MKGQKLTQTDMLNKISYVQAGVVEIMQRQQQGWAYIRTVARDDFPVPARAYVALCGAALSVLSDGGSFADRRHRRRSLRTPSLHDINRPAGLAIARIRSSPEGPDGSIT